MTHFIPEGWQRETQWQVGFVSLPLKGWEQSQSASTNFYVLQRRFLMNEQNKQMTPK